MLANPICIMVIGGLFASTLEWMQLGSQVPITGVDGAEAALLAGGAMFFFVLAPMLFMIFFGFVGVVIGSVVSMLASILPMYSPNAVISKISKINLIFNAVIFVILLIIVLLM